MQPRPNPNEIAYRNSVQSSLQVKDLYKSLRENFASDGGFVYYLKTDLNGFEVSRISAVQVMLSFDRQSYKNHITVIMYY